MRPKVTCHRRICGFIALVLVLALPGVWSPTAAQSQSMAFKQGVAEAAVMDRSIADYFRQRAYAPLWTDTAKGAARRVALLRALDQASLHGLPEQRYDLDVVFDALRTARSEKDLGRVEVALTKVFLLLARDMQTGILEPRKVVRAIKRDIQTSKTDALLDAFVASDPARFFATLAPDSAEYRSLLRQKLRLEKTIALGGWGATVPVQKLERGDRGDAVIRLRTRLETMGYLTQSSVAKYDRTIEAAVREMQADHGLEVDGVAGISTLEELNVAATARLKSVLVALERERWLNSAETRSAKRRSTRQILVNLTDFSARVLDAGAETFYTRAVVGKNSKDRRSPEFSDLMEFMVINPTWHVPRSIAVKEYLPKLRANPNAASYIRLVNSRGQVVSRDTIDFAAYDRSSFPYSMKQPPSKSNALGLVKFMFPNEYNIYLHDTPHKKLFGRETRAFSHGCIRLSDPFGFAYHLLAVQEDDAEAFFASKLATGRETQVDLEEPVPVHIVYRTAISDAHGEVGYRRDVYGRDDTIWKALSQAGVSLPDVQG